MLLGAGMAGDGKRVDLMKMQKCPVKNCLRQANGAAMCSAHWRRIKDTASGREVLQTRANWFASETMNQSRTAKMNFEIAVQDAVKLAEELDRGERV